MSSTLAQTGHYVGTVVKKPIAEGSKQEHNAVMLVTETGEYKLRRAGGNPFQDNQLDALVGKTIDCLGALHNNHIIMVSWKEKA